MELIASPLENIQNLGVIEGVIATKLTGRAPIKPEHVIREFSKYAKGLSPDERRSILNEGFTEAVAAHLDASRLPDSHPQKEYAELRAQTISEFMGWLGNASGDVANVKAGKNEDGTYKRMTPLHYKASLAVDSYKRATEDGDGELAEAIKRTTMYSFEEPLERLMDNNVSAVSRSEVTSTLDKVKMGTDKSKVRTAQVLAATALSMAVVATTASPSAANEKVPEMTEIDNTKTNDLYATKGRAQPYKINPKPATEAVVIKEVALSDVPAPKVNATPKTVDTSESSTGTGAKTALLKEPIADTITFTPETVNINLPAVEKVPVRPTLPKEVREAFTPEPIKADLPEVISTEPKEIADDLAPEIVKIDSGLNEEEPKVTIVAPTPVVPAPNQKQPETAPKTEAPAPPATPAPEATAPAPEVLTEQQQFSLAAQKLIDRGGEWTNRGRLMKIFIDSGEMTPMHAAAFIGNFMVEAPGLDPATHQVNGHGRGFVQWGNKDIPKYDRFGYDGTRGLVKFAKERGKPWQDFDTQAHFVLHELRTTEKGAYVKIMATTNREAATLAVSEFYERPGEPHNERRIESANIVASGYNEELRAIQAAAKPPVVPTPEITTIGHKDNEGKVGDIPYAYQLDPRWANMPLPDGTGPIGPVACNPTSLSMVAMAIGDKTATPDKVYARYIADDRIGKDGAHQQSILDLAPVYGLRANLIPNTDIEVFKKVIKDGGKIILSGNTNRRLLPNPGHFVVIYGISESGNMLVADPGFPENNGKEFSLQAQVDASNAIRARLGTTNAGLHYNAVALYPNK